MKRIILILAILLVVAVLGAGLTVRFTESAEFCSSCHVMESAYQGWSHSSHREHTNCNSCHVPHQMVSKVFYKAKSGLTDAYVFFVLGAPKSINTKEDTQTIVQKNCVDCHSTLVREIGKGDGANCYHCHRNTPHGDVRNLVY